jgi:hypothetical protein
MSVSELPRRQRQRAASQTSLPQQSPTPFEKVMAFPAWCKAKGISLDTGKRLRKAGKIRVIKLSANRVGVTESADREYMQGLETA